MIKLTLPFSLTYLLIAHDDNLTKFKETWKTSVRARLKNPAAQWQTLKVARKWGPKRTVQSSKAVKDVVSGELEEADSK